MSLEKTPIGEEEMIQRLHAESMCAAESPFPPGFLPGNPRPAAVLMPLLRKDGQWHILFIRRTIHHKDPHSGQVAFPGGGADPGDTGPDSTALREAQEEIGLAPADVRILGQLRPFDTVTNYRVTPVVGVIPWPYPLKLETREVSRAFTIPLDWLTDKNNRIEQYRTLPEPYKPVQVIYFNPYDGETLWGASARFVTRLIEILHPDG
jgi:8-oxo-dGTP pyrophosphatase MutT (NUDIX family)